MTDYEVPVCYDNTTFDARLSDVLEEVRQMLLSKNAAYGDSALNPVRVFSKADTAEQIRVRLDDKVARLKRGDGSGNEDAEMDMLGYLVLLRIATKVKP